ncbi:C40 family peptidase [Streptomyces capoamus]|uniref:C40 family peptidase n=1 Tax=Streptomyces capoamus TaxID=68183 RepID=UPI001982D02D|nr:hypothetical protein GCM10010501_36920 [Streptomyces libani subsp. rufus]
MASHRKPRPGGTPGAGIGTPALATAALTSVAVLSQSAGAAPAAGHAVPSPEEVERKIDDLYRRAESAAEAATAGKERGGRADRGNARDRGAGRGERADVRSEARAGAAGQTAARAAAAGQTEGWAAAAGRAEGWAGAPEQRPEWGQDRTGRDERSVGADGGGASGRRADSLQRLRDEVARRAQHRALPSLRGKIPAQRGTGPTGGTAAAPAPGDVATAPSIGSTDLSSAVRGMGTAPSAAMGAGTTAPSVRGSGIAASPVTGAGMAASPVTGAGMAPSPTRGAGTTAPSVRGSGIAASPVTGAGMAPSPTRGAGTTAPSVTGAGIAPAPTRDAGTAASAGDTGVAATSPGKGAARHARTHRSAPPVPNAGIAQPAGDTGIGRTGRETGPASPFGDTGATPLVQSVPHTAVAPPVHETGPVQPVPDTVVAAPARDTAVFPPLAHGGPGAVGREPAATSFTGAATATATPAPAAVSASASAMAVPQAAASAAGLTDTVASGPMAAKAAVQKKLAHARVLLKQQAVQAAAPSGTYATKARKAIAFARAQLGKPCVWGAAGPGSYDCSGLTQAAWKSAGVTLPRTAREQAEAGTRIVPADARPGDLVFFHDDVSHVGLCTGDGMMIHAPRPGAYVREEPVSGFGDSAVRTVVRPG